MSDQGLHQSSFHDGEPPRLLADRYRVLEEIGSGASAITFRGLDLRLDRPVAIKILRRDGQFDPAFGQRFDREARLAASISNPHVVQVFDAGQHDGWLYLVMELVEGQNLKSVIERQGPLSVGTARDIATQILAGLQAIHAAGILHRDIKPQNVLIDHAGRVKVTDFGIAQGALDSGLTSDGTTLGTASYMAPEQARGSSLSEATDIYAVGVVLFEMLTGQVPFERATPMATMLAQIEDEPPRPSMLVPDQGIPPRLEGVVLQAMAKGPNERFRTAAAMTRALEAHGGDPGATTRLPTTSPSRDETQVVPRARNAATSSPSRGQAQRPPPPSGPPPRSGSNGTSGGNGRGGLTFVLVAILLAMVAVAALIASQVLDLGGDNADETPTSEATIEATATTESTATNEPLPTDEPIIIPATNEPPTAEPPTPTTEPSPTVEVIPTEVPPTTDPEPTEEVPIIEPGDAIPWVGR